MPDFTLLSYVTAAIVGAVAGIKALVPSINGYVTVAVAIILGVAAGFIGIPGVTWFWGLVGSLAAVGGVTIAGKIGGK